MGADQVGTVRIKNVRRFGNKEPARNKVGVSTGYFFEKGFFFPSLNKEEIHLLTAYYILDTVLHVGIKR